MPPPPDLPAALDAWELPAKLIDLHRQRLILGLVGTLAATGFNLMHPPAPTPVEVLPVAVVVGLHLLVGGGLVWIRTRMSLRPLARREVPVRERALALAAAVNRPANAWLAWAAVGHLLIAFAAPLHLELAGGMPGPLLGLMLLPSVGLAVHGWRNWPDRAYLLALDARSGR